MTAAMHCCFLQYLVYTELWKPSRLGTFHTVRQNPDKNAFNVLIHFSFFSIHFQLSNRFHAPGSVACLLLELCKELAQGLTPEVRIGIVALWFFPMHFYQQEGKSASRKLAVRAGTGERSHTYVRVVKCKEQVSGSFKLQLGREKTLISWFSRFVPWHSSAQQDALAWRERYKTQRKPQEQT